MKSIKRPTWDAYFMHLAHIVSTRSNCIRRAVGAVIVQDRRVITTGYNGTPSGVTDCDHGGCKRCLDRENEVIQPKERKDRCICVCAEQNAIFQSALHGISTKDASIYVTVLPCPTCTRAIINSGIREVVYDVFDEGDDDIRVDLFKQAGITVRIFNHK